MACPVCNRMHNSAWSPRNHHHCENRQMHTATTLRAALRGVVSRKPTWRQLGQVPCGPECWEAAHDSRKKLFVASESRTALRGRWTPATCILTILKGESPLVMVALKRARSTGGLEGKAATKDPELHSNQQGATNSHARLRMTKAQVVGIK